MSECLVRTNEGSGVFVMVKESVCIVPVERIRQSIYVVRRQKVMLDSDLALL